MKKWEYDRFFFSKKESDDCTVTEQLDKLGDEGWEAFSVIVESNGDMMIFLKREIPEPQQNPPAEAKKKTENQIVFPFYFRAGDGELCVIDHQGAAPRAHKPAPPPAEPPASPTLGGHSSECHCDMCTSMTSHKHS